MKSRWWSLVLGLLSMLAGAMSLSWTVSQNPLSISSVRVNSSAEITCSTTLSYPMGLNLLQHFQSNGVILHLNLENGQVTKVTTAPGFEGRVDVASEKQSREGCGFTMRLSHLGLRDTDMYYCSWTHYVPHIGTTETQSSDGTIIIVSEKHPQEQCSRKTLLVILISLSVMAFAVLSMVIVRLLIVRRKRVNKHLRPSRAAAASSPVSLQCVCPQHQPYMITCVESFDHKGHLLS